MKPLVSICIPLYNHEKFILKLLDSIIEDTYENKEIVLINDGSKDSSDKVVNEWIKKNKEDINIKYISRENQGLSKTINQLINESKGKYLVFSASDDYLINNTIEKRVKILEKNSNKLMLIADAIVVDENNNKIYESGNFELHGGRKENYFTDEGLKNEVLFNWSVVGSVYMFDREIYNILGRYDSDMILEDYDYAVRAVSKNLLIYLDEKVAAYRLHSNNTVNSKDSGIKFSESCIKTIQKHGHNFSLKDRIRLWNRSRRLKRKIEKLKRKKDSQ